MEKSGVGLSIFYLQSLADETVARIAGRREIGRALRAARRPVRIERTAFVVRPMSPPRERLPVSGQSSTRSRRHETTGPVGIPSSLLTPTVGILPPGV